MSFILDALRKSENERQRNATPGIADAPIRQRSRRRSVWLPLVAVLLGINLSLVAVLWYMDVLPSDAKPDTSAAAPVPTAAEPVMPVPVRPIADPAVSRELSAELEPASETPKPAAAPFGPTPSLSAASSSPPAANIVDVPTLAELSLDGSLSLPELHLDLHVYSETRAERFVFINTAKYKEGDRTREGPLVDEINQLGVILTHDSRRFLLTRE
jgi:general secretion pathway protein B